MTGQSTHTIWVGLIIFVFLISITAGCTSQQASGSEISTSEMKAPHPVNTATFPTPERVKFVPTLSASAMVIIEENDFEPLSLVIMNGTTVTWINNDETMNYSVVSTNDAPESFQSGVLTKGGKFLFTFTKPGTYPYHSTTESEITGEIVVL